MGLFGKKQEEQDDIYTAPIETAEVRVEPQPVKKETTVIGEGITIVGDFSANEDIRILGTVQGNIASECSLSIASSGKLLGNASVRTLQADGIVEGEVFVSGLTKLGPNSEFRGTLSTLTFEVENGALFDGHLKIGSEKRAVPVFEPAAETVSEEENTVI